MTSSDKILKKYKLSVIDEILGKIEGLDLGGDVESKIRGVVVPAKKKGVEIPKEKRCNETTLAGGKCSAPKCTTKCWAHMTNEEKKNYKPKSKKKVASE